MKRLGAVTLLATLMLIGTAGSAHDFPVERTMAVQLHTSHVEVMVVHVEPAGPRTQRILALHDQNRDGKIEGSEAVLAKPAMRKRALLGLDLELVGVPSSEQRSDVRFRRDKGGGFSIAAFRRMDFVLGDNSLDVAISLANRAGLPSTTVLFETVGDWQVSGSTQAQRLLKPGDRWVVRATRNPVPASPTTGSQDLPMPELPAPTGP